MHRWWSLLVCVALACACGPSTETRTPASGVTGSSPGVVRFDAATTPKRLPGYGRDQPVLAVALAPDARRLATFADGERELRVYDVAGGRELCRIPAPPPRDDVGVPLLGIAFAPSTDHLAIETAPGTIAIYDASSCALVGSGSVHAGAPITYADGTRAYPFTRTLTTSGDHLLVASSSGLVVAAWADLAGGRFRPLFAPGGREVGHGTFDPATGERLEVDLLDGTVWTTGPRGAPGPVYNPRALAVHDVVAGPARTIALLTELDGEHAVSVIEPDGDELARFPLATHHLAGAALAWKDADVVLVPSSGEVRAARRIERPHLLELHVRTRAIAERPLPLTKQRSSARSDPPAIAFDRPHAAAFLAAGNATGGVEVVELAGPAGAARVVFSADWQGEPRATASECERLVAHVRALASGAAAEPDRLDELRRICLAHARAPDIACFLARTSMEELVPAASPSPCGLGAY